jgi:hypothetical protein
MRLAALIVGCGLCAPACTVSAVSGSGDAQVNNSCSTDSDCEGDDADCISGLCQPKNGELEALLIEVTPPSDSAAPHLSFVSHLDEIPTSGGELSLPPVRTARVTGSLRLPTSASCYPILPQDPDPQPRADNLSLPINATLIPRERLLGLPQQLYLAKGDYRDNGTYYFEMDVPPGAYDVYMVPDRRQQGCVVPPQLFRAQDVRAPTTTLDYQASKSSVLELRITWPKSEKSLDGWTADIIEPLGGKPISTEVKLGAAFDAGFGTVDYNVKLFYSTVSLLVPVPEAVASAADLVRLRPPEGAALPTIVLDRSALGLLSSTVSIDGFTRYPDPVTVTGQLASASDGRPLLGSVTVVATRIASVDEGMLATFQRTVDVPEESDGIFSIEMPPGKYRVYAVPDFRNGPSSEGELSALETEWEVALGKSPQAGKLLELRASNLVQGRSLLEGAEVRIAATLQSALPFVQAIGEGGFVPRERNALVDSGRFALSVDAGRLDISLRPAEALGFAWFVKPGVEVTQDYDLGGVPAKIPSALRGTTTGQFEGLDAVTTRPVAACSVRAYAYLDKDFVYTRDKDSAVSVVQVAETRSDESGAFRLLVPSSLAARK